VTDAAASPRAFRRAFTAVIVVLTLVCGGLLAVAGSQGPRLVRTDVDPLAVVQQSRQRLVLAANRPLQPVDASRIRMEPGADFRVDTQADRIIIDFARPLAYDADYTVAIDDVRGVGGGPASDLRASFRTGDPGMYVLIRGGEQQADRIVRQTVAGTGSGASDVVFEATKIQEYAVVGESLVVATLEDDGTNGLVIAALDGSGQVPLPLPDRGTLQDLHAEDAGTTVGFRFTSADGDRFDDALMVDDVASGAAPTPVVGLDGRDLSVQAWGFVPGRPQLVAHGQDGDLFLVTVDGSTPLVPLGRHGTLGPFSADGTRLAVTDPGSTTEIDLRTAEQTTLPTETHGARSRDRRRDPAPGGRARRHRERRVRARGPGDPHHRAHGHAQRPLRAARDRPGSRARRQRRLPAERARHVGDHAPRRARDRHRDPQRRGLRGHDRLTGSRRSAVAWADRTTRRVRGRSGTVTGSDGLLAVALSEARARRLRTEAGRRVEDATGDRPDAFDARSTPAPGYAPLGPRVPWWRRLRR
jgi:hypothetical protein